MEHCFACDNDYAYLGTIPHRGTCPACGSSVVTPAGDLSIVGMNMWESANGLSTIRVTTADRSARHFEFTIAARRGRGKLVCLVIDETEVPVDAVGSVPATVATAVTAHGIRINNPTPAQSL